MSIFFGVASLLAAQPRAVDVCTAVDVRQVEIATVRGTAGFGRDQMYLVDGTCPVAEKGTPLPAMILVDVHSVASKKVEQQYRQAIADGKQPIQVLVRGELSCNRICTSNTAMTVISHLETASAISVYEVPAGSIGR